LFFSEKRKSEENYKIPITKKQFPNNNQSPNSNIRTNTLFLLVIDYWNLFDYCELIIGIFMSHRIERLNELIRQVLGRIILEEEDFGLGVLVTIMKVQTSPDVLHSNVFLSVYPTEKGESVLERMTRHVFGLQQLLNKKLEMRPVPKIRFILDKTEAEAQEIYELIEK